jgi:hypothetical protein
VKVYPGSVNVLVVRAVGALSVSFTMVPVPPLLLKVTVWDGFGDHWAYKVTSAVKGYEAPSA